MWPFIHRPGWLRMNGQTLPTAGHRRANLAQRLIRPCTTSVNANIRKTRVIDGEIPKKCSTNCPVLKLMPANAAIRHGTERRVSREQLRHAGDQNQRERGRDRLSERHLARAAHLQAVSLECHPTGQERNDREGDSEIRKSSHTPEEFLRVTEVLQILLIARWKGIGHGSTIGSAEMIRSGLIWRQLRFWHVRSGRPQRFRTVPPAL